MFVTAAFDGLCVCAQMYKPEMKVPGIDFTLWPTGWIIDPTERPILVWPVTFKTPDAYGVLENVPFGEGGLSFRFKTTAKDGLIAFFLSPDQQKYASCSAKMPRCALRDFHGP